MHIKDFQGMFKFKIFIPALYLTSWFMMVMGPLLFDTAYQLICFGAILYFVVKAAMMGIYSII